MKKEVFASAHFYITVHQNETVEQAIQRTEKMLNNLSSEENGKEVYVHIHENKIDN
ncbi:hypothetical protein [Bacillus thuringiensis]|uniref:hypothetical protein n=1 Tax=Bacillus thuringiensis TaxID=1428 RepID=UPI0021D6655C|nr:hypothetical protein [Bacillus thuringiensis]MCU7667557.1 hypothetical protein [Bacillus thuringiensis]